jgi:hypothetical protein
MPTRLHILTARRRALVARSEALRSELVASTVRLHRSLGLGQMGAAALRSLRRHPALVVGVAVALLVAGPARLLRVAALGLGAWSLFDRLRSIAAAMRGMTRPD